MRSTSDLPLFQKTYDLYKYIHAEIKKFPKGDRYALGESCKKKTLNILESIIEAGSAKREWKIAPIERALKQVEILKVFIRLSHETKCLPEKHYLNIQERIQEIGRMLGGWSKSL